MSRTWSAFWFITIVIAVLFFLHAMVYPNTSQQEGFMPHTVQLSNRRCGVDLPSCIDGEQCLNGYCSSTEPPKWPEITDLPIRPPVFSPLPWSNTFIPVGGRNESAN